MPCPRAYFDLCTLKRGWDDSSQLRIRLEAAAVETLLHLVRQGAVRLVHSSAHDAENATNPRADRRAAVQELLDSHELATIDAEQLAARARAVEQAGVPGFDAVHLSAAVILGVDVFVTTDDRLIRRAVRLRLPVRVVDPISWANEIMP